MSFRQSLQMGVSGGQDCQRAWGNKVELGGAVVTSEGGQHGALCQGS
jgi:hypothetical protein